MRKEARLEELPTVRLVGLIALSPEFEMADCHLEFVTYFHGTGASALSALIGQYDVVMTGYVRALRFKH